MFDFVVRRGGESSLLVSFRLILRPRLIVEICRSYSAPEIVHDAVFPLCEVAGDYMLAGVSDKP